MIAFALAAVTVFIIPPDRQYSEYVNRTVLIQLFCLMTAVCGFRSIGVFEKATSFLLKRAGNVRRLGVLFTLVCFFASMLVTNDVALITFVPLTLMAYRKIADEKSLIYTVVLETAAANLGSMVTPFGNPQNLYIYDRYGLTLGDYFGTMMPSAVISLVLLAALCCILPKKDCVSESARTDGIPKAKAVAYLGLFAVCLLTVFRVIPDWACLLTAAAVALILDRTILLKVDYGLLATFVCFFVFVGNISRIGAVSDLVSEILGGRELIVSVLLSQVISNVPASVMLSGFTENGKALLLGVNLGGLGTIIASLASLISFQLYRTRDGAKAGRYMLVFSLVNFGMLAVLLTVNMILHSY